MYYCQLKENQADIYDCLSCKYCLPPALRINGKMCNEINWEDITEKDKLETR